MYIANQPVIRTLSFNSLNLDVKTISDYTPAQLYHITRKNSHPRALALDNQKTIGGVLLHKSDCGNFSFFQGDLRVDNIQVKITVEQMDAIHPLVTPPTDFTLDDNIEFSVCFIYEEFGLDGVQHDASFWWRY